MRLVGTGSNCQFLCRFSLYLIIMFSLNVYAFILVINMHTHEIAMRYMPQYTLPNEKH